MKKYIVEIDVRRMTGNHEETHRHKWSFRADQRTEALALCWAIRPEGEPDATDSSGYDTATYKTKSKTWTWYHDKRHKYDNQTIIYFHEIEWEEEE